jgi:hypothetical protein
MEVNRYSKDKNQNFLKWKILRVGNMYCNEYISCISNLKEYLTLFSPRIVLICCGSLTFFFYNFVIL